MESRAAPPSQGRGFVRGAGSAGGGELAAGLVQAGLVDDFLFFLAPKLLGAKAVPAIGGAGWTLAGAPALSFKSVRKIGPDLLVHAIRQV